MVLLLLREGAFKKETRMKHLLNVRLLAKEWLSKPYVMEIVIVIAVLALLVAAAASENSGGHP